MKKPLIILTGPTAVGKTALSIALAKAVNGEIISADSMQVYKGMDIGSAKITKEEMGGVKHYLIDVLTPFEEFHVVKFKELANQAMEEIWQKGKIPILTGGTGFYIQAVLYDIDFTENGEEKAYREELERIAAAQGASRLHEMLQMADPVSAQEIHENNVKRVIRALEYHHQTGQPISAHNAEQREKKSDYNFAYFVLNDERSRLYERIDKRVDVMVEQGLVEEVRRLKDQGCDKHLISMQGLGYKEILDYLEGGCTLEDALYLIKRDTRHFAKRQLTWFKREKEVIWIDKPAFSYDTERLLNYMMQILKQKEIIENEEYNEYV